MKETHMLVTDDDIDVDFAMRLAALPGGRKTLLDLHSQRLDICQDPECLICGVACCVHREPLHFHHDGCPASDSPECNDCHSWPGLVDEVA